MDIVKDHIDKFSDILIPYHDRMVIGGIYALKMHGLNTRDTADLDMIVYNPTEELLSLLKELVFEETDQYPIDFKDNHLGNRRRSYKLTRDSLTIDFLIEHDECQPHDLLKFRHADRDWPVQSLKLVLDAKRKYNREKDIADFEAFKRDNF